MKSTTATIILNWNCASDTLKCVDSLLMQTTPPDLIVVDNASGDNSVEVITQYIRARPDAPIYLIANPVNSGFAGGINTGITHALKSKYTYIGSLNPDATADKKWVESLVDELRRHQDAGIVTGILARTDKKHLDTTGEQYTTWGIPGPRMRDGLLKDVPKQAEYIFGATGGAFIARGRVRHHNRLVHTQFILNFH